MSNNDKIAEALGALAEAVGELRVETAKNGIALAALVQEKPVTRPVNPDFSGPEYGPAEDEPAIIAPGEDLSADPNPELYEIDPKTNRKVPLPGFYGISPRGYPLDEFGNECYRGTLDRLKIRKPVPAGAIDCFSCGTRGGMSRVQKTIKGKPVNLWTCHKCKAEVPA